MYIMEVEKIHSIFAIEMNAAERAVCLKLFSNEYFILQIRNRDFFNMWRIISRNHPRMICTKYKREVEQGNYWMYIEERDKLMKIRKRLCKIGMEKMIDSTIIYRDRYEENLQQVITFLLHAVEAALDNELGVVYFTDNDSCLRSK